MHTYEGGCTCRAVRYRLLSAPLIVHGCHCRWCQRESGSSFALNAMIESERVELLSGAPAQITLPSASGKGQVVSRCPTCQIALWSNYGGRGDLTRFVRVGTLDEPDRLPPDVHIFVDSKQPWVTLSDEVPAFGEFYDRKALWRPESLERLEALMARVKSARPS